MKPKEGLAGGLRILTWDAHSGIIRAKRVTAILAAAVFVSGGCATIDLVRSREAAMAAKVACSGVYVANRPYEHVLANDVLPIDQAVPFLSALSNATFVHAAERKSVSVRTGSPLASSGIAAYRDNLGCALLGAKWPETDPPLNCIPEHAALPDAEWPAGNRRSLYPRQGYETLYRAVRTHFEDGAGARAVVVVHHGRLVAEHYDSSLGLDQDSPLLGWSMAKTITGMLVGIEIGHQGVERSASDWIARWTAPDPRAQIKVKDLLEMRSGLEWSEGYAAPNSNVNVMLLGKANMSEYATESTLKHPPGKYWEYSSGTTNILQLILRHKIESTGSFQDYCQFPYRSLFHRIGAYSARLEADAAGTYVGSSYLYATPRDWARLGMLMLHLGKWPPSGEQILPSHWIDESLPKHRAGEHRYGWQTWGYLDDVDGAVYGQDLGLPEDAYHMRGHWGQSVTVVPSRDMIIIRLGWNVGTPYDAKSFVRSVLAAVGNEQ
ncbi:serine hydrolase domain-containing protein [Thauera sinica]|uniref:Serine hydrolase domain-containing protein n=1 Tax=Thauera sinica TaxID=2665146 RepID=A0ABW1ARE0_9RHOO|nr:serine hydrolase [Thauera sp. K11]